MTMSIVTSSVEVGLVAVLEVVLDVTHLVVHCDEVLLVHPVDVSFHPSMELMFCAANHFYFLIYL